MQNFVEYGELHYDKCYHFKVQWNLSNADTMGQKKVSLLESFPHFRGRIVCKSAFGERKGVLIREVSLLQRFTLERFHCMSKQFFGCI